MGGGSEAAAQLGGRRLERLLMQEPLQVPLGLESLDEFVGALLVRAVHDLHEAAHVAATQPLEQVERVRDQDAA